MSCDVVSGDALFILVSRNIPRTAKTAAGEVRVAFRLCLHTLGTELHHVIVRVQSGLLHQRYGATGVGMDTSLARI